MTLRQKKIIYQYTKKETQMKERTKQTRKKSKQLENREGEKENLI